MKFPTNPHPCSRLAGAVLLATAAALPALADYQSTVLSQGPVGYYRLNETTQPLSYTVMATNAGSLGASANGNYNNYPTRALTGPFAGSFAVGVDGISQTIQAPYSASLNPATFTIEAWLNPGTTVPSGGLTCVLSSMHSGSPRSGWLIYQSSGSPNTTAPGWQLRMYNTNGTSISIPVLITNNVTPGTFYHIVFSFDGTTAKGYLNGVLVNTGTTAATTKFVPNVDAPFSVGARSDNGFAWQGQAAEVAYYANTLSDSQIAAHYAAASTNTAGYGTQILGDTPILYYRFREPADPVAANSGTLGASASGRYVYPAHPGVTGPVPSPFTGFDAGNKAVAFDGAGGSVTLKPLNLNTNTVTITGWLNATGLQAAATGLIMARSGSTVAGLTMYSGAGSTLSLGYIWNNDPATYNFNPTVDAGLPGLPDSTWAFVALVVQPDNAAIYIVDSTNYQNWAVGTNFVSHPPQPFEATTEFGLDPGFNNRNFVGAIDEVAFFNRALAEGEVYTEYAAGVGNLPPRIFVDPQSPANAPFVGDSLGLWVDAGGTPALTYQWRKNSTAISGATTSAYANPSLALSDSGNYDCVVANGFGTVTSQVAVVSVSADTAPVIVQVPAGRTLFPGGTLNLSVLASGGQLHYQWLKGGSPIANATGSAYVVPSVTSADAGNYTVTVTNFLGSTTSSPAAAVSIATLVAGSYEATVAADSPLSLWRLDESSYTTMYDIMGRNDGYYTNSATLGAAGVIRGDPDTAVSADGTANWFGVVPFSPSLGSGDFTLECWAKVPDSAANYCPVSFYQAGTKHGEFYYADAGSGTWRGAIGAGTDPYLFYYLGDTPFANIVPNKWMHLVITYAASGGNIGLRCYVNGEFSGNIYGNFGRNNADPLIIGGLPGIGYKMKGTVDEVAFYNHALSLAQIQAHYNAALYGTNSAPVFTFQPGSQALVVGQSTAITSLAEGSSPITYQWYKNGGALSGQTANTLALNNVAFTDYGTYQVVASNAVGATPSQNAVVTVSPLPTFANATNKLVLHLKFDGDYTDATGRGNNATPVGSPTFVSGKIGSGAFHFNTDVAGGIYNYATLGATIPNDLLFSSNVNFSVAYWVRLPAGALPGDLPFLCSQSGSTFTGTGLTFAPSYKLGGWAWSLDGTGPYGANNSINDGNWHSLVHTFDRAGNGLTYLDGVLANTTGISSVGDIDGSAGMNIGQDPTGTYGESGAMDLDDLGVWTRVLSPSEASAIYYAGTHGTSFDTYGPVTVTLTPTTGGLVITWQAGTLLQATSITGPWSPVAGAAAPNYRVSIGQGNVFFKVKL